MLNAKASLSASLLARPGHVVLGRGPGMDESREAAFRALFCDKRDGAAPWRMEALQTRPLDSFEARENAARRRFRASLRLTRDRQRKLQLAASFLQQTRQSFLVDALDRHLERVAQDPANEGLLRLFAERHDA